MARRPDDRPDRFSADAASERSRKRFARRQWRRRWLAWRRVLVAVLVLGGLVGGVWLVWFSETLAVTGVEVRGTRSLTEEEVRAAAAVPLGDPLVGVDLDRVESRVRALASVRTADVSRQWPDRVLVEVSERVPIAVVELGGELRAMDADGVVFHQYRRAPADLPRVEATTSIDAEALRESARVISSLPDDLTARVHHVEVESVDQISLVLRDRRVVRWGSADDSAQKSEVLTALLSRRAQEYDVSVPGRPTTRD